MASDGGIANMQGYGFQFRIHSQSISGSHQLYKEKADAWKLQKQWYQAFTQNKPTSPDDLVFWRFISDGIDWYFDDCYKSMVKMDIRDNGIKSSIYWMKNRNAYQLSRKDILLYAFLGLKRRLALRK